MQNTYLINLENEIEYMKDTLNYIILNNSLTDALVVSYSQKLDKLIVKYELYKCQNNGTNKKAV